MIRRNLNPFRQFLGNYPLHELNDGLIHKPEAIHDVDLQPGLVREANRTSWPEGQPSFDRSDHRGFYLQVEVRQVAFVGVQEQLFNRGSRWAGVKDLVEKGSAQRENDARVGTCKMLLRIVEESGDGGE